jgi:hypothetical protein
MTPVAGIGRIHVRVERLELRADVVVVVELGLGDVVLKTRRCAVALGQRGVERRQITANVDQSAEAWYCRACGYFHSASSSCGDSMRCRSSSAEYPAPALTSESNPNAPPSLSAYQYDGGIQS